MDEILDLDLIDTQPLMTEAELDESEEVVERGLHTYVEVGQALAAIRDRKGYRFRYGTFAEYVESRWKMSIRSAYENITAAQVAQNVRTSAQIGFSQAVSVSRLPVEQQQKFVESHDVENMSVRETNEAVKEWERKLRESEQRAQRAEEELSRVNGQAKDVWDSNRALREENERLKREKNPEPQVVEKVVEIEKVPDDYEQLKQRVKEKEQEADRATASLRSYMDSYVDPQKERKAKIVRFKTAMTGMMTVLGSRLSEAKVSVTGDIVGDPEVSATIERVIDGIQDVIEELHELRSAGSRSNSRYSPMEGDVFDAEIIS